MFFIFSTCTYIFFFFYWYLNAISKPLSSTSPQDYHIIFRLLFLLFFFFFVLTERATQCQWFHFLSLTLCMFCVRNQLWARFCTAYQIVSSCSCFFLKRQWIVPWFVRQLFLFFIFFSGLLFKLTFLRFQHLDGFVSLVHTKK